MPSSSAAVAAVDWDCAACSYVNRGGKYCSMCGEPSPKRDAVIAPPASSSKAMPTIVVRGAARRGASPAVSGRDTRALERARLLESVSEEARGRPVSKTTSEVRTAERARVLAAVGGIDPSNRTTSATPPRARGKEQQHERRATRHNALVGEGGGMT